MPYPGYEKCIRPNGRIDNDTDDKADDDEKSKGACD